MTSSVLVVAIDTLKGFVQQKLLIAIAIVAVVGTAVLIRITEQQKTTVQHMTEAQQETVDTSPEATQDSRFNRKPTSAQFEAGFEQLSSFMQALFFGFASICGTLVSLGLFSTLLASPMRRGELRTVLTRPLTRWQYVAGRTSAGIVALIVYWGLMSIVFGVYNWLEGGKLPPVVRLAPVLYLSKGIMIGCIGMALSLYMRPILAAAIALVGSSDWVQQRGILYMLLPGDDRLSVARQLMHGSVLAQRDVLFGLLYAADVSLIALMVVWVRFRNADIA
jgi:hypothetical protein